MFPPLCGRAELLIRLASHIEQRAFCILGLAPHSNASPLVAPDVCETYYGVLLMSLR